MRAMIPHAVVAWDKVHGSTLLLGERMAWAKGTLDMQEEIRDALEGKRSIPRWFAWLVRQPENARDPNAIAIYIGSTHVGWVAAPMAAELAPQLDELRASDPSLVPSCLCTVRNVKDRDDEDGKERVMIVGIIGPWPAAHSRKEDWAPTKR